MEIGGSGTIPREIASVRSDATRGANRRPIGMRVSRSADRQPSALRLPPTRPPALLPIRSPRPVPSLLSPASLPASPASLFFTPLSAVQQPTPRRAPRFRPAPAPVSRVGHIRRARADAPRAQSDRSADATSESRIASCAREQRCGPMGVAKRSAQRRPGARSGTSEGDGRGLGTPFRAPETPSPPTRIHARRATRARAARRDSPFRGSTRQRCRPSYEPCAASARGRARPWRCQ